MYIERLDHLVLTVRDIEASLKFYRDVLGMRSLTFGDGRPALAFGRQKISLQSADAPGAPHAAHPTSGSADLCFVSTTPVLEIISQLERAGVALEAGPAPRTDALGAITSVCFRDPDGNLIEVVHERG
jgi:catechol 2,3-dioxygenase-like lactoylglutathione lyase family enzyme